MNQMIIMTKRLLLPVMLVSALGGCVVQETMPAGHYVVNADGSRSFVQGAYTCPVGYTCTYPNAVAPGAAAYTPVYYGYSPGYYSPYPYLWAPAFFGLGYYWGGHGHHYRGHGNYHHGGSGHRSGGRR